jgi:anthranilate phosphoribosyltransferase
MIKEAIEKIVRKGDLTYDEAYTVMNEIMSGEASQTQNAAFLAALSTKSTKAETIEEISGCAEAMREHATPVSHEGFPVLEIVGTGGDHSGTFNISTTAAIVIASAGIKVAKHGNRAASSKCGAADVLEALGVEIRQSPEKAAALLQDPGICFLFAQEYHASMKYVGSIRRELGIRTVFNILGPLTNPARPDYYVLGVYDEYLVEPIAKVLSQMGVRRALVVYGQDHLDEISPSAPTTVTELKEGFYRTMTITPESLGLTRGRKEEIIGGSPEENAEITRAILSGAERGTRRTAVLMNAGAGLYVGGRAESLEEGVQLAAGLIDDGTAEKVLERYIEASHR